MASTTTGVSSFVGRCIRDVRRDRGRSQLELAELMSDAGFRWSRSTVARTEKGSRPLTVDEVAWVAQVLDVPLTRILPAA